MDPDPERNVGHTDLSGESDFHPAAPVSVATPAVAHPGAGQSSAMVTRSRARGGREINVEPEVEFRPDIEFLPEAEIPAETDEVSGATRHLPDIASQDIPETAITQEVRTSASRLPIIPRSTTPHNSVRCGHRGLRPMPIVALNAKGSYDICNGIYISGEWPDDLGISDNPNRE